MACRRKALLKHLGSDEILTPSQHDCCDVCGSLSVSTFKFLTPVKSTRKSQPTPVRNVSTQMTSLLKTRLLRERRRLLDSNMKYKALGGIVACPVGSITEICKGVKYIKDACTRCNFCSLCTTFFVLKIHYIKLCSVRRRLSTNTYYRPLTYRLSTTARTRQSRPKCRY